MAQPQDNNFKQMLSNELAESPEAPGLIENRIDGSIGMISHVSKLIELYIPNFIDALMVFLGGKPSDHSKK